MADQIRELNRLKRMVLGLGSFILVFSSCGFVIIDVYLLSNLSEGRMNFLTRTMSYLQTSLGAMITLRNMELLANFSTLDVGVSMDSARSKLLNVSMAMSQMHSLNYMSPPTQTVAEFYNRKAWNEKNVIGGDSVFGSELVNFWDLMNDFISAIQTSAHISVDELSNSDYSPGNMGLQKRAVAFM
jgi:hypothetical protein